MKFFTIIVLLAILSSSFSFQVIDSPEKRLQQMLFEENSYNNEVRPVANANHTVNLYHDLAIQQILDVDLKQEQVKVVYWTRMYWSDVFLQWNPDDYAGIQTISVEPRKIWLPDIVVYNSIGDSEPDTKGIVPIVVSHEGNVSWMFPIVLVTTCPIHIRHFPYDRQTCEIKFGPWASPASSIGIYGKKEKMDTLHYKRNGEWMLLDTVVRENVQWYPTGVWRELQYEFNIQRRALFYEKNVIIPTALISCLATVVFLLPSETGEKIGLAITVFLALCVQLLIVSDMMPATSIETPIIGDYYLMAITMVAISLIATVFILNLHNPHSNARRPAHFIRFIFLDVLSRFLLFGGGMPQDDNSPKLIATDENIEMGTTNGWVENDSVNHMPQKGETPAKWVKSITDRLDEMLNKTREEEEQSMSVTEWQLVTRVLDRLLFVSFLILIGASSIILIGKAKMAAMNAHSSVE